jgi:hypothetical protein
VASAGDVNGDGYPDLIVGAPGYGYGSSPGVAYLFLGGPDGVSATPAVTFHDPNHTARAMFAYSVAGVGDINGDGYSDLLIGAYSANGGAGAVYVYFGGPTGPSNVPSQILLNPGGTSEDLFGYPVATAGDVNGDGYADVIIGADGAHGAGAAYVFFGSSQGLHVTPDVTLLDPDGTAGDSFGSSVACAGDVDGDGLADIVVGAMDARSGAGVAFVYLGNSAGISTTPNLVLTGPAAATGTPYFGSSVSSAGDVNGDGYADVVIGADGASDAEGAAYVFFGGSSGLAPTPGVTISDPRAHSNDVFGYSAAGAGDLNGDGYADLVIGAPNGNVAYVFPGGAMGPSLAHHLALPDPNSSSTAFGMTVASTERTARERYSRTLRAEAASVRPHLDRRNGSRSRDCVLRRVARAAGICALVAPIARSGVRA